MDEGFLEVYILSFDTLGRPQISLKRGELYYDNMASWSVEVLDFLTEGSLELDFAGQLYIKGSKIVLINTGKIKFCPLLLGMPREYRNSWLLTLSEGKVALAGWVNSRDNCDTLGSEPRPGVYEVLLDSRRPVFAHSREKLLSNVPYAKSLRFF